MAVAYYGDRISPHMTDTPEGFLICHDVPIARTGPQDYLAREMMLDGDPERIVTVQRHPEDVFEAATLASFEGKPITDGHPPENVGPENYSAYTKGHVQNVRRSGDYIVADLYINDANLAEEVRNNVKREVSCGYLCSYVPDGAGYRQSNIRGNHVAVVPKGRAGAAVAIQDTAPEAEKGGNKHMNEFWKSVLHAFGMAAKDASPEELDKMVETTATALDAEPAEKAQEAEPAESKTAEDEMVEKAPKGDDLGSKLDRIISMLEAKSRGGGGLSFCGEPADDWVWRSAGQHGCGFSGGDDLQQHPVCVPDHLDHHAGGGTDRAAVRRRGGVQQADRIVGLRHRHHHGNAGNAGGVCVQQCAGPDSTGVRVLRKFPWKCIRQSGGVGEASVL